MKKWKLVLFDLDNTLYSNEHSWENGIRHAMAGMKYSDAIEVESFFRRFKQRSEEMWGLFERNELTITEYRRERYIQTMREWDREPDVEEADRFHSLFSSKVMDFVEPFPMLHETMTTLVEEFGMRVGIITNGPEDHQQQKIDRLSLQPWFAEHNLFNSQRIGVAKPDRRIFEHALRVLDEEAEATLFVGDSWEADVVGAIGAGMDAIWLNTLQKQPKTEHRPLAIIDRFDELLPTIQRLQGEGL